MAGQEALVLLFGSLAAVAAVLVAGFGRGWFASGRSTTAPVPSIPTPAEPMAAEAPTSPEMVAEAEAQTAQAFAALERVADALQAQAAEIDAPSHGDGAIAIVSAPTDLAEAPQSEITEVTAFEPPVTVYDPPFPTPSPALETAATTAEEDVSMATPSSEVEAIAVAVVPTKRSRRSTTSRTRRTRSKRSR